MKTTLTFLIAILLTACNTPLITKSSWDMVEIPAPSLQNSMLEKDANTQTIGIYLPPSYLSKPEKKFPVVYFLQGYGQSVSIDGYISDILNEGIKKDQIPEMIYVEISGKYLFNGSFYHNSKVTGNWEDFIVKDVISYLDNHYRTIAKSESRALCGHSMGGYGALEISMKHPEIYKVCYSMSPGLYNAKGLSESFMFANGGTIQSILNIIDTLSAYNKEEAHKKYMEMVENIEDWKTEATLAYGMSFAPNTDKAPYFNYPVSISGKDTLINDNFWFQWEKGFGNVRDELIMNTENLRSLKQLTIDCGYNDEFRWITKGTQYYTRKLEELRIPFQIKWHNGTHGSLFNQSIEEGLFPTVANALDFE